LTKIPFLPKLRSLTKIPIFTRILSTHFRVKRKQNAFLSNPCQKLWINYEAISDLELDSIIDRVKDTNLKHTLEFGIGMHHAGLVESDRKICEELFLGMKIQVLIATSTLAWGVNLPAHMVIVKG